MDADDFYDYYKDSLDNFIRESEVFDVDAKILIQTYLEDYEKKIKRILAKNAEFMADRYNTANEKRHYYDKYFNIAKAMAAKIENVKEIITYKLTQIIENAKKAQNRLNPFNMDKEIDKFKRDLNKQQISTLEQKARDAVPEDEADDLFEGPDAALYYQNDALAGHQPTINEYYPKCESPKSDSSNSKSKGGTINKKYRKKTY